MKVISTIFPAWGITFLSVFIAVAFKESLSDFTLSITIITVAFTWTFVSVMLINKIYVQEEREKSITNSHTKKVELLEGISDFTATLSNNSVDLLEGAAQLEGLISDSNKKLQESFKGLSANSDQQGKMIYDVISRLRSNGTNESTTLIYDKFTEKTTLVLGDYVELTVMVSDKGIDAAYKMQDMSNQMDNMFALLSDIKYISEQTDLLALNASIEAARAGQHGRGFNVVANEIRGLAAKSGNLNKRIQSQVHVSKATLRDTSEIIREIASLDMNDALDAKSELDYMIKEIEMVNRYFSGSLNSSAEISKSIQSDVAKAIMALQYEDLASQLITYIKSGIEANDERVDLVTLLFERKGDEVTLEELNEAISNKSMNTAHRSNVVSCNSMDQGNLELF